MFITLAVVKLSKVDNVKGERYFWAHSFGGFIAGCHHMLGQNIMAGGVWIHSRGEARSLKEGARDNAPFQGPAPTSYRFHNVLQRAPSAGDRVYNTQDCGGTLQI